MRNKYLNILQNKVVSFRNYRGLKISKIEFFDEILILAKLTALSFV